MSVNNIQKPSVIDWDVVCVIPDSHNAMTVQIGFLDDKQLGETEFCIEAGNRQELDTLFEAFCKESGLTTVYIKYVTVIRTAETLEELTEIEEHL